LINEPDLFHFDRVDVQFPLDLIAPLLSLNQLVAERSRRSVPEALARVFLHGADDVLGIFLGLVFVEQGDDLAHHGLHRLAFVTNWLGDRDHLDTMLAQLPKIKLLFERLAEEPAVTMNEDQIECLFAVAGTFDHLLEDWPAIVTGGSPA